MHRGIRKILIPSTFSLIVFFLPLLSHAQVAKIVFTTDPQTIKPGEISGNISIQTQDASGNLFKTPETISVDFVSTSATGEFLSPTSGSAVSKTISTGDANKNFRYRDSTEGNFSITVNAAGKTSGDKWSASQNILVSNTASTATTTSNNQNSDTIDDPQTVTTVDGTTVDNVTPSAHYSAINLSSVEPVSSLEIGAGRQRIGMVGTPISFKPEMKYSYGGNMIFKWNFGDGSIGYGSVVSHAYAYPGDYVVMLNTTSLGGQAVSRTEVTVIPGSVSISFASPDRVEVSNDSKNEINLFGRALSVSGIIFIFPEDTIIKSGQKISFAGSVTGLAPTDKNAVSIIVVGDSVNKAFVSPNTQANQADVSVLSNKIREAQITLNHLAVRQSSGSDMLDTVSVIQTLNQSASTSATTTLTTHRNWWSVLKAFFSGRKQ